jgi:hypothetical protein
MQHKNVGHIQVQNSRIQWDKGEIIHKEENRSLGNQKSQNPLEQQGISSANQV